MSNVAEAVYNVECMNCEAVFIPLPKSRFWWMAKQHEERGFIDAVRITGKQCGCIHKPPLPGAPFRVLGYTDDCRDFDIPCNSFVTAARAFLNKSRNGCVVFIQGVSPSVEERLRWM